ncbi:hypothetical protein H4R27_004913 [Coemansia aciculifera]|nr:hypothetical protein H4R27_004913 [Coemansia aciculifera]
MHAKAVSALMIVSAIGMTGYAQDVGNGDNGGQVGFAPNIPDIPEIDDHTNGVSILGNIEDIPPIDSINFGEGNYPNKNDVVNNDDDKNGESYSCTTTIEVTVTRSSTLPYCDETSSHTDSNTYSFGNGDDDDDNDDSSTSKKSSTKSSKSAASSHGMSALYSVAIAAALAVVNVALF